MSEKKGIENLKKLAAGVAHLGPVGEKMAAASGSLISKLALLSGLAGPGLELAGVDYKQLSGEFKDLDDAEKAELLGHFKAEFDLSDDAVEGKVEAVLAFGLKLEALALEGIALVGSFKSAPALEVPSA